MVPGKSAYPVGKIALEVAFGDDRYSRSETLVGSRVLAKPLRFELWGAREVLSLPIHTLAY